MPDPSRALGISSLDVGTAQSCSLLAVLDDIGEASDAFRRLKEHRYEEAIAF